MILDNNAILGEEQAITTSAATTSIYDTAGTGAGTEPSITFGSGGIGVDLGSDVGNIKFFDFMVTTAGTGSGTVTFAIQAAEDDGSNDPDTYLTLSSSAAYTGTDLALGDKISLPIPSFGAIKNGMGVPRFYRGYFTVSGTATVSITTAITINSEDGIGIMSVGGNYTV